MNSTWQSTLLCPAKLNLGLLIPFRYPGGYHHIVSLFVPIDFGDTLKLTIEPASTKKSGKNPLVLSWKNRLPDGFFDTRGISRSFDEHPEENLLSKVARMADEIIQKKLPQLAGFQIKASLEKKIPSPAGLGGGSSDAGALLRGILHYLEFQKVKSETIQEIKREFEAKSLLLGSDIPFFMELSPALISGRGEVLSRPGDLPLSGILGVPSFGFQTPSMYKALNRDSLTLPGVNNSSLDNTISLLTKNGLHTDLTMISSLRKTHSSYEALLLSFDPERAKTKSQKTIAGLLFDDKSGTLSLQNDFTEAAKELFPAQARFLENAKKKAGETLKKEIVKKHHNRPVITSMSGSGAAIFALFYGRDPGPCALAGENMRSEIPEMFWTNFQSIPVK